MPTLNMHPLQEVNNQTPQSLHSVDEADSRNAQRLGYYAGEIFRNLLNAESTLNAEYLQNQPHINHKMRAILVDWLVSMHMKFRLLPETLYLSVHLVDRYLEKVSIQKKHLQLVGIGCMLISTKYEEIYPPQTKDFISVTEHAYNKQQLLKMENDILKALEFNLTVPSAFRFLERYARLAVVPPNAFNLARFISELALVEYHMVQYKASVTAAAALYVALKVLKMEHLVNETVCEDLSFKPCAKDLFLLFQVAHNHPLTAVKDKFARVEFNEVSKIRLNNS